jgi:hypothetical protein
MRLLTGRDTPPDGPDLDRLRAADLRICRQWATGSGKFSTPLASPRDRAYGYHYI